MKNLLLITCLILGILSGLSAQTEAVATKPFSIANIEFSITPKQIDNKFKVQFLFPRSQELEIVLTDMNGDLILSLLETQVVSAGVKNYDFELGENFHHASYLLVIRSMGKSLIKKFNYLPKT